MCNRLKDKSIINFDAARVLKENPNYHHCSSIHCSYYSCFQIIKYILCKKFRESDHTIYTNRISDNNKGEHEYVIEYIHKKLIDTQNFQEARTFKNKINELKSLRVKSDYKDIWFEKDKSDEAYQLGELVLQVLKTIFHYES